MGGTKSSPLEDALRRISHGISGTYYVPIVLGSGLPSKDVLHKTKKNIADILQSTQEGHNNSRVVAAFKKYAEIIDLLLDIPEQDIAREKDYARVLQAFGNMFALCFNSIRKGGTIEMLDEERGLLSSVAKLIPQQNRGAGNPSAYKLIELGDTYVGLLNIYRPDSFSI